MTSDQTARRDQLREIVLHASRRHIAVMRKTMAEFPAAKIVPSNAEISERMNANGGQKTMLAWLDASMAMVIYEESL